MHCSTQHAGTADCTCVYARRTNLHHVVQSMQHVAVQHGQLLHGSMLHAA
jgi:hypothetical protein